MSGRSFFKEFDDEYGSLRSRWKGVTAETYRADYADPMLESLRDFDRAAVTADGQIADCERAANALRTTISELKNKLRELKDI